MYQYWFISFSKCTTLLQEANYKGNCVLEEHIWELSLLSAEFSINLKNCLLIKEKIEMKMGFPGSSAGKESTCNARDTRSIPASGRSSGEEIGYSLQYYWAFLVAQMVEKNPPLSGFNPWVRKIPWRRAWQPTPVFLPGESPWTEEPGGLQSMGLQRVGHNWVTKDTLTQGMNMENRKQIKNTQD